MYRFLNTTYGTSAVRGLNAEGTGLVGRWEITEKKRRALECSTTTILHRNTRPHREKPYTWGAKLGAFHWDACQGLASKVIFAGTGRSKRGMLCTEFTTKTAVQQ